MKFLAVETRKAETFGRRRSRFDNDRCTDPRRRRRETASAPSLPPSRIRRGPTGAETVTRRIRGGTGRYAKSNPRRRIFLRDG